MSTILVFVEHSQGTPRRASLEALGAARAAGGNPVAVATGSGAELAAARLGAAGASKVHVLAGSASPGGLAQDVARIAREEGARAVLAAASSAGKDLVPRVAALLDAVPFTECVDFRAAGEGFEVVRPWLAGKCLATARPSAGVLCATLRPNVFAALENAGGAAPIATSPATDDGKTRVVSVAPKAVGKLDVKEAPVVVSGGRGLKEAAHFRLLEDLAAAFGGKAAVGASRAVVDAGWRPHAEQVGQTGKTVAPQLYIAVGISGAIQHLAGMRMSKVIVAINKDADAPIFKIADYGIVGDAFEVLPALTAAVQKVVSEA